jgi:hypothetical protein
MGNSSSAVPHRRPLASDRVSRKVIADHSHNYGGGNTGSDQQNGNCTKQRHDRLLRFLGYSTCNFHSLLRSFPRDINGKRSSLAQPEKTAGIAECGRAGAPTRRGWHGRRFPRPCGVAGRVQLLQKVRRMTHN